MMTPTASAIESRCKSSNVVIDMRPFDGSEKMEIVRAAATKDVIRMGGNHLMQINVPRLPAWDQRSALRVRWDVV